MNTNGTNAVDLSTNGFGDYNPNWSNINAPPPPPNGAQFISQSVSQTMTAGQSYSVSITMKNTGSNTWTTASNYNLGSQNAQDNTTWGLGRVALPSSVASGSQATLNFTVTAPTASGTYNFQWRMVQDFVEWFGDFTPNVAVTVNAPPGGNPNAEPDPTTPIADVRWIVADQLGTPRMILDQSGSLANVSRHDYLPFGEELPGQIGGRTTQQGYAGDSMRQKFTQKERDIETGLDYFGARYYSSQQGRFTSVDPSRKSIHPMNPQSWNRYSYTYNNPLVLVDDNGKWPTSTHNKIIDRAFDALSQSKREQIKSGSASVDANWNKPGRLLTENTLMESQAYKHAMTPGAKVTELGSVGAAQKWANAEMYKFIDGKLGEAQKQFQAGENQNGVNNAALVTFGEAMHPVMDNMSPAHRWIQVYDSQPYLNTASNAPIPELAPLYAEKALYNFVRDMNAHSEQEARDPTQDEMNTMVDQMRTRYLQTFGQEAYKQAVSREEREATERRLGQ